MAVQEQTPYIEYVANGVTTTFPITFDLDAQQSSVSVKIDDDIAIGWSIIGNQVVFTQAPPVDSLVKITRITVLKRETTYQTYNNSFRPEVFNKDFDRVWYALQEQNFKVGQYDYDYNYVLKQVRPISTGGTGANNSEDARTNLNTYSKEEVNTLIATGGAGSVVGVAGGGTGGTTAQEARSNLGVYSKSETNTAIEEATPQATETIAGKAKIATTSIAQEGVNDTDFITPKKLNDTLIIQSGKRSWVDVKTSRSANTWYQNTTGHDVDVVISASTGNLNVDMKVRKIGSSVLLTAPMSYVGNNLTTFSFGYITIPNGWEYLSTGATTWLELRV